MLSPAIDSRCGVVVGRVTFKDRWTFLNKTNSAALLTALRLIHTHPSLHLNFRPLTLSLTSSNDLRPADYPVSRPHITTCFLRLSPPIPSPSGTQPNTASIPPTISRPPHRSTTRNSSLKWTPAEPPAPFGPMDRLWRATGGGTRSPVPLAHVHTGRAKQHLSEPANALWSSPASLSRSLPLACTGVRRWTGTGCHRRTPCVGLVAGTDPQCLAPAQLPVD